jgi:hypothetical protein
MTNERRPEYQGDQVSGTSLGIVAAHLLWMVVGPFALGALLLGIVKSGSGWLTGLDLGLLIAVVLMVCARWIDQRSGRGTTVYGEPSTWADFRRYALILPVLAGAAWFVANVIGNYLLAT